MADGRIKRADADFRAEFHAVKLRIIPGLPSRTAKKSYFCVMIRKACCKINLGLDVVRRREDGYHDLETLLLPVAGLYDTVEAVPCGGAEAGAFNARHRGGLPSRGEPLPQGMAADAPAVRRGCRADHPR